MAESTIPNLKILRTERLLTQDAVADAVGVSKRTIIRWENGEGEPVARELLRLAQFYGVSIDQLVGELVSHSNPIKVASLQGRELDYWVARSLGLSAQMLDGDAVVYEAGIGQSPVLPYSTDWAAGGPIIERSDVQFQQISAERRFDGVRLLADGWLARCSEDPHSVYGPTQLVAGMRAHLAFKYGTQIIT